MWKKTARFFDKLEDKVRVHLSHRPILYAFIGAIGIILVWKGVWETAEFFPFLFGPPSFILGAVILLLTGLMVSFFIGDSIILSGFKGEKKLAERTENEIRAEKSELDTITAKLEHIEEELDSMTEHEDRNDHPSRLPF